MQQYVIVAVLTNNEITMGIVLTVAIDVMHFGRVRQWMP